jgi:hypothetical protein
MTRFRQALLDELMTRVIVEPTSIPAPAPRRTSRRLVFVTAGGLAALVAAVALPATLGGSTPAYALGPNPDGSVTITFNDIAEPTAINRTLHDAGIRARVMLPKSTRACPPTNRGTEILLNKRVLSVLVAFRFRQRRNDGKQVNLAILRPDDIPVDTIMVFLPMQQRPRSLFGPDLDVRFYRQPGPSCVVAGRGLLSPTTPVPNASQGPLSPSTPAPDHSHTAGPTATPR